MRKNKNFGERGPIGAEKETKKGYQKGWDKGGGKKVGQLFTGGRGERGEHSSKWLSLMS